MYPVIVGGRDEGRHPPHNLNDRVRCTKRRGIKSKINDLGDQTKEAAS